MRERSDRKRKRKSSEDPRHLDGHFLISEITLRDPNFYRSVILMISHDAEGAFGLVVNHASRFTLGEAVDALEGSDAGSLPVYVGGPVQREHLFVLHSEFSRDIGDAPRSRPIEGVIFEPATQPIVDFLKDEWSAMPEAIRPVVRLYAGYSGWGPGQVEGELKIDSWVVLRATRQIVFHSDPENAWAEAFAQKGPLHQIILQTGFKPSMN